MNMTPEQYLRQITDIDLRIRSLEGELYDSESEEDEEYRDELQTRIGDSLTAAKTLRSQIRDEIQNVRDNRLCALLTEKYVRGRSWEQIAETLNMRSVKHVREGLHGRAVRAFVDANPEKFKRST